MQERDSFGLNYSQSIDRSASKDKKKSEDEELEQLSPNKQTMLETYKENIMKPLGTEPVLSSLTSVENEYPSLPNPSKPDVENQSQNEENKHSLPSIKEIKKINSKVEERQTFSNTKSKEPNRESLKTILTRKITDATENLAHGV